MIAKEGRKFEVGQVYKITYYQGMYLKDFIYSAVCVSIEGDKAVFRINKKNVDYLISNQITTMEKDGSLELIKQDVAVQAGAAVNPGAVSNSRTGIIYAENIKESDEESSGNLITLKEYASLNGVNPDNVRQKILRGTLPGVKKGRDWFIDKSIAYK